jgi:F420-dependent oxidoreductase-like protein
MDFGYHTTSFVYEGAEPEKTLNRRLVDHAQLLEDGGFSWFTVMDHYWQLPGIGHRDEPTVECYSALSALAETTDEMALSGLVTCVHYRNPALLAKMMASLDVLSEGRAVLGIGAGWNDPEYEAVGMDFPDPATRVKQMRDAIELCQTAWSEDSPVDYDGEYYDLDEFYCNPKRDIPILVGGGGEQLTLRVAAEYADWWNVPGTDPETYEHKLDVLRDHCRDLGTGYGEIKKTVTLNAIVREEAEAAHGVYEDLLTETDDGPTPREEFRGAVGSVAEVCDLVETYRDMGVETFQIEVPKNDRRTAELFVDEVLPQF